MKLNVLLTFLGFSKLTFAINTTHLTEDEEIFADEEYTFDPLPDDGKCRALALRGGGSLGAYELGVL